MKLVRSCVLIPAYETPRTLEAVVRQAQVHCPDVIVVDDGSVRPATDLLRSVPGVAILRHGRNRGKGAALKTGLKEAQERGFTHAVALDSDGQHLPDEIPLLLEAARRDPEAIHLGNRDLLGAGAGLRPRLMRANSNFWTWVETGLRLPDTLSGFRCYPVETVNTLHLTCEGYDFEIEVLAKAAWAGIPLKSVPIGVRYFRGDDRVSHFRPFADFLRVARLNTRLVLLRIALPAPYLGLLASRAFREKPARRKTVETLRELFVREPGSPRRIAASVGLGLFMGIAPVWGFQVALTLLLAHATGLSKPIAVVASHVSFPLIIPLILYASLVIGRFVLGVGTEVPSLMRLELAPPDLPAWILGSIILALLIALVGSSIVYWALICSRRIRKRKTPA